MKSVIKKIIAIPFFIIGTILFWEVFTGDGSIYIKIIEFLGVVIFELIAAWLWVAGDESDIKDEDD